MYGPADQYQKWDNLEKITIKAICGFKIIHEL